MVRGKWAAILVAGLACSGLSLNMRPAAAGDIPQSIMVNEPGKPPMQCRVLRTWNTSDGVTFEVEVMLTGERMTIVESGPISMRSAAPVAGNGKVVQEMRSRIYRWSHNTPPPGCPIAPANATLSTSVASSGQLCPNLSSCAPAPAPVARSAPASTTPGVVPPVFAPVPTASASDVKDKNTSEKSKDSKLATPAQSDWHKSWGKPEDRKAAEQKAKDPKVEASASDSHMPPKDAFPQAAKDPNDPIKDPAKFSPYDDKAASAKKDDSKDAKSDKEGKSDKKDKDGDKKGETASKGPAHPIARRIKDLIVVRPADKHVETPKKEDATAATAAALAKNAAPGQRIYMMTPTGQLVPLNEEAAQVPSLAAATAASLETDPSNAFTVVRRGPRLARQAAPAPDGLGNAFGGNNSSTEQPVMPAYQQVPAQSARPPMMPYTPNGRQMSYQPVMQPMVPNPAANPAMSRPMMYNGMYNNVMPATTLPPVMDRGPIQQVGRASVSSQASSQPNTQQMLLVLRSSLYPSHREWAADQLGAVDARANPMVVELLAQSAKNDLAPSVRAACVRNLSRMSANSPTVAETLAVLQQTDENPMVRDEASRALSQLHAAGKASSSVIQPASLK